MKNQIIGILFIVAGFAGLIWHSSQQVEQQRLLLEKQRQADASATPLETSGNALAPAPVKTPFTTAGKLDEGDPSKTNLFTNADTSPAPSTANKQNVFKKEVATPSHQNEKVFTIENAFIRVTFTNYGGAIKHVAFIGRDKNNKLLYPATVKSEAPYLFNQLNPLPALALNWDADGSGKLSEFAPVYELMDQKDTLIRFRLKTEAGIEIIRAYKVTPPGDAGEPYIIRHETRFINTTAGDQPLTSLYVNLGTLPPTEGDTMSQYLNFTYHNTLSNSVEKIPSSQFINSNGFLGMGSHRALPFIHHPDTSNNAPLQVDWASVTNQFFSGVAMPSEPGKRVYANGYPLGFDNYKKEIIAINGYLGFDLGSVKAGEHRLLGIDYYVGPKETNRLEALGKTQKDLMQFGWGPFGFVAQILLACLAAIHSIIVNFASEWAWGISIITLTCLVKGALFPLTAIQIRSSKKMQAIAEPMKLMREKYKNNPQKLQTEMMKMFKDNQVNPAAGCLPILVQFPIFIGLYNMLQTASELRFGSFLWIQDLSVPDSISWLPIIPYEVWFIGGPIHILPVLMCITMYYQMKMMPTPTTDNMQVKMLKWMPFIFFPITYYFPSGVTLYWTVSNVLTIIQTHLTKDMRNAPVEPTPASATPPAKKVTQRTNKKK